MIVAVVAAVVAAAVAVIVAATVVAVAAVADATADAPLVTAAAVQSAITVVGLGLRNFGATETMRPIAAAREPVAASAVADGMKVSQGQILMAFASTTAVTMSSAS